MTSETENLPEHPDPVPEPTQTGRGLPHSVRRLSMIFAIAVVVLVVDQVAKAWAQTSLVVGAAPTPLLGDLIQLRLIYNSGAALSIGSGTTWLLTALSAGVVVFIVVTARAIRSTAWAVALGLVLGGALGNLVDRLLRAPGFPNGHVVDFIDYGPFIGNVADIAIVAAAVFIGFLALRGVGPDGRRADGAEADESATGVNAAESEDSHECVADEAVPMTPDDTSSRPSSTNPTGSDLS